MINSVVSISEQAFFSIITSALEAYKIEHVMANGDSAAHVETFGHLWGYYQQGIGGQTMHRVVWADTSTAVERDQKSVSYTDEALELKQEFIWNFFPEVDFLGDYHSHPYSRAVDDIKTELELERRKLYQFSDGDFRSVKASHDNAVDYRVGLVATVFERDKRVNRSVKRLDGESCIRFQYRNMTIWLKAYVWGSNDNDTYRRKSDSMVRLLCPILGMGSV